MNWYRVELDKEGAVVSCAQVDGPTKPTHRVFYMWMASEEAATRKAVARYQAYLSKQREGLQSRRDRHKAEGLCRCGRKKPANRKQCDVCIDTANAAKSRAQARVRGEAVPAQPPKSEAFARRREQCADEAKLEVFELVHRVWCRSTSDKAFTAWLVAQIRELKGKVAA